MLRAMHTHFGSATHLVGVFLGVLIVGSFWRLAWAHAVDSPRPWLAGLARAALTQY